MKAPVQPGRGASSRKYLCATQKQIRGSFSRLQLLEGRALASWRRTNMASKHGAGAPDLLQKLGRPGFPKGMVVLLVGSAGKERQEIEEQLGQLCYRVVSCETCARARQELNASEAACFDIILAEAALVAKDNSEGQLLLQTARGLPLVLISSPGTITECVWRGIEVGAADVLEKPLSLLKLQNIWQHVVRKAMDQQQPGGSSPAAQCPQEGDLQQGKGFSHSSLCTLSSNMSAATIAPILEERVAADHESCFSGSLDGKEVSVDAGMSNTSPADSHAVESSSGFSDITQLSTDGKPAKKLRRFKEPTAMTEKDKTLATVRSFPTTTHSSMPPNASPTVLGMVHPCWANSSPGGQAFKGGVPPGCVWGTPLHLPPGWQGMFPNGAGPMLGSAANHCSISRCHSAPVQKTDAFSGSISELEGLPGLDGALIGDITDDLLLDDDFLDCGDSFLSGLNGSAALPLASPLLEKPPIGLQLRKSESFVNMINLQLNRCRSEGAAITPRG